MENQDLNVGPDLINKDVKMSEPEIDKPMEIDLTKNLDKVTGGSSCKNVDNKPSSAKKIKLSQEKSEWLKFEKEKLKASNEIVKMQREITKLELEKARVERERLKVQRENKLKEERERKEMEKQMKIKQKEEEKEKREKLKKEKEEERLKAKEAKELEKKRRLEEKQAQVEEEARKKETKAKIEKEKLEKSQAILFNFLKKSSNGDLNSTLNSSKSSIVDDDHDDNSEYSIVPKHLLASFNKEIFSEMISKQDENLENLYLNCLLTGKKTIEYCHEIFDQKNSDKNDVKIIKDEEELTEKYNNMKYVYLKFDENVGPPYFGPKLENNMINGRRPLAKSPLIDYDIDTDDEWENCGPGEDLTDSGSEKGSNDEEPYEIDNDFVVPHGYLSDDENLQQLQEAQKSFGEEDENDKARINKCCSLLKEQALIAERTKTFSKKLLPQIIGCYWLTSENNNLGGDKYEILKRFQYRKIPK